MVSTLEDLCYSKFTETVEKAPSQIQKLLLGETRRKMEKKMENKITEKITRNITGILNDIIPEILEDILKSNENGILRRNFFVELSNLNPSIIKCAIQTAENIAQITENRYNYSYITSLQKKTEDDTEDDTEDEYC